METKNIVIWRVDNVKQIPQDPFTARFMPNDVDFEAVIKGKSCKSYYNGDINDIHRQLDERLTDNISTMYPKTMICMPARANGKSLTAAKAIEDYIKNDLATTSAFFNIMAENRVLEKRKMSQGIPSIKNVIFNDPATIVFWSDDTKTVVKCQEGDTFDPEKGLAMAITKKALGNKGNYCDKIKKWLPKEKKSSGREIIGHVETAEIGEKGVLARVILNDTKAAKTFKKLVTDTLPPSFSMEMVGEGDPDQRTLDT